MNRSAKRGAATAANDAAAASSPAIDAIAPAASASPSSVAPVSSALDYESRRQAQIQRNQQLLTQLTGMAASTSLTREQMADLAKRRNEAAQHTKEARARARADRLERMALLPRRDLPPRRARADVDYAEDAIAARASTAAAASPSSSAAAAVGNATSDGSDDAAPSVLRENASLSDFVVPDSAPLGRLSSGLPSAKQASTQPLAVLARHLGQTIPLLYHAPKASAMSFLVSGWPSPTNKASQRATPTFNKMSGIQKLDQHIAIFVNIDESAEAAALAAAAKSGLKVGGYGNQWSDGGRRLTWYAQPTQRVDTPVIGEIIAHARAMQQRMEGNDAREAEAYARTVLLAGGKSADDASVSLPVATAAAAAASSSSKRGSKRKASELEPQVKSEPGDAGEPAAAAASAGSASNGSSAVNGVSDGSFDPKSLLLFLRHVGGPYIYAGRLAYHAHDTRRTPMQFIFTLADFETLRDKEDFRKLLPDGGKQADADAVAAAAAASRKQSNGAASARTSAAAAAKK
jgi:hypothetical protein